MMKENQYISVLSPQLLEYNINHIIEKELEYSDVSSEKLDKIKEIIHNIIFTSVKEI